MPGNDRIAASGAIETDIPARLDALHWSGFHTRMVVALGITWTLDGLEVTLAGSVAGALKAGLLEELRAILHGQVSGCIDLAQRRPPNVQARDYRAIRFPTHCPLS